MLRVRRARSDRRARAAARRGCRAAASARRASARRAPRRSASAPSGSRAPPTKRPQQHPVVRRAMRPLRREPRRGEDAGVLRRAARRNRIRSGDARSRCARKARRDGAAEAYGISPHRRASSSSRSRVSRRSSRTPASPGRRRARRALHRSPSARRTARGRLTAQTPVFSLTCSGPIAPTSARTISLRPPGSDRNDPAGLGVARLGRSIERRGARCRARARPRRAAERAPAPTADRRRRRECPASSGSAR